MDEAKKNTLDYVTRPRVKGGWLRPSRFKPFWPIAVGGASIVVAGGVMWYRANSARQVPLGGVMAPSQMNWRQTDGPIPDPQGEKLPELNAETLGPRTEGGVDKVPELNEDTK